MTKLTGWKMGCILMLCAAAAITAEAQTFTKLANFEGRNGAEPDLMSPIQGRDAGLYGTTQSGGIGRGGTIFRMLSTGKITGSYSFSGAEGSGPASGLLLASDGNFYGTTSGGNCKICGILFRISPAGNLTTLHSFCSQYSCQDGSVPEGRLVQGTDGNIYGTTFYGGGSDLCPFGCGTVFKMTLAGTFTMLHSFDYSDGSGPFAGLTQDLNGNLYGVTCYGGERGGGGGTFFMITAEGIVTVLYIFDNGSCPAGTLTLGSDGNFYGTMRDFSSIFKMSPQGVLTRLHSFDGTDGAFPSAQLVVGSDGNFYGTTSLGGTGGCPEGCGTIFAISPAGSFTSLYSFAGGSDGMEASGGLIQDTNGVFYGTTFEGGNPRCNAPNGCGTIFSLDMGLAAFVSLVQPFGKVGQTGGILGQGFTNTTSVTLNGLPAIFKVVSDTYIRATVPAGATTGYVTVTTPSGTLTSNVPFHVIP